ncbi:MAG: T9SS type A sorting domain-containing protein [Chitinophagaceae bacterium]|nr:T9SS type A sorting domain-containing protein [Chitinophagaceae bacterium]
MKKILLLSMMALVSAASFGQYKNSIATAPQQQGKMSIGNDVDKARFKNSHTKTRGGTQYYDYAAYLEAKTGNTPSTFVFFMFPDSNMRFDAPDNAYGIQYRSVGATFDPYAKLYQDFASAGDLDFWTGAPFSFKVDSVFIAASYNKVSADVDTLTMSLVSSEGTNLPIFYFAGGNFTTNFGVDTGRFAALNYDPAKYGYNTAQIAAGGPAAYTVNRVLSNTDTVGPAAGGYGLKYLGFNGNNFTLTPGEIPAVSFTFKPGFTWTAGDQVSTKNHFLFRSSEPNGDNTFMPYYKGDYNQHSVVYKDSTNWGGDYIPTIAWSQGYAPEVHDIVWKITCDACGLVGINDLAENIHYTASPNPTSSVINFDMNFENSAKNVTITLTNLVGQPVRTMELGAMNAQVDRRETMNVSDLTPGFYFYTIKADNQKLTDKILIK